MANIAIVESEQLSDMFDKRYVVINQDTGEVLDDAQGYGYKTIEKAHAAWAYKHRDKSKDVEKKRKQRQIKKWMKEHQDFVNLMDDIAFEIAKGSWGPDAKFNAKLVKQMLEENNLNPDFATGELLKAWKKE